MANLELQVQENLEKNGFYPTSIQADGKIHRFKRSHSENKEDAWYVCFLNDGFLAGSFGDWVTREKYNFCTDISISPLTKAKLFKKIDKKFETAQDERWQQASLEAEQFWNEFTESIGMHAYLVRKKIGQLYGARIADQGKLLIIPVMDFEGKLWGFQKIQEDGKKLFHPGTKKKGNFCKLGEVDPSGTLYLCEGYATGCSIFEAIDRPVLVCFDAGNLVEVARVARAKFPEISIVICGDDDFLTEGNPGRSAAEEAAKVGLGVAVFPRFQ